MDHKEKWSVFSNGTILFLTANHVRAAAVISLRTCFLYVLLYITQFWMRTCIFSPTQRVMAFKHSVNKYTVNNNKYWCWFICKAEIDFELELFEWLMRPLLVCASDYLLQWPFCKSLMCVDDIYCFGTQGNINWVLISKGGKTFQKYFL